MLACAAGGLLLVGGGAAFAASRGLEGRERSLEIVDRAAEELGVDSEELRDALKTAALDRVDEAREAGEITDERAAHLKEAIESGGFPLVPRLGPRAGSGSALGPFMRFGLIDAAADYLGLTRAEIRRRLFNGRSLAEIAQTQGKSVDGLEKALVQAARRALEDAVEGGYLTEAQRDARLENLRERAGELVQNRMGPWRRGLRHHAPGLGCRRERSPRRAAAGFEGWVGKRRTGAAPVHCPARCSAN